MYELQIYIKTDLCRKRKRVYMAPSNLFALSRLITKSSGFAVGEKFHKRCFVPASLSLVALTAISLSQGSSLVHGHIFAGGRQSWGRAHLVAIGVLVRGVPDVVQLLADGKVLCSKGLGSRSHEPLAFGQFCRVLGELVQLELQRGSQNIETHSRHRAAGFSIPSVTDGRRPLPTANRRQEEGHSQQTSFTCRCSKQTTLMAEPASTCSKRLG